MNRVELLSSKFNKFIKRDYPIIKNIEGGIMTRMFEKSHPEYESLFYN